MSTSAALLWPLFHQHALVAVDGDAFDLTIHYTFYWKFGERLPCMVCAQHYYAAFSDIPFGLLVHDRESLFAWTVMIHNAINRRLGKPNVSVEEAIVRWNPYTQ